MAAGHRPLSPDHYYALDQRRAAPHHTTRGARPHASSTAVSDGPQWLLQTSCITVRSGRSARGLSSSDRVTVVFLPRPS